MNALSFWRLAAAGALLMAAQSAWAEIPPPVSSEAGRIWNPLRPAIDNHPLTLRILVLNYDPEVPMEGHRRLSEVFKWNAPERLALRFRSAMEYATGGAIRYEIVEWRNLNEIYAQRDGYRPTIEEYVKNRRAGSGWHEGKGADYPRLLKEQGVAELVSRGVVDEVWIFSDHFYGLWEASMAGPGAFNINGGVYPQVPSTRPFAFYGFNYERGVAEMMHDAAHRTEATLNRAYGGWNLASPTSNWDKFSANAGQSDGKAGVGTCHWPANAERGYDYGNKRAVESWADAFLTYPRLDWTTKPVSRATWAQGPDDHADYMKWYFAHVPRAPGINADGRQNNWFKYIWDFENYDRNGLPLPGRATVIGQPVAKVGESGIEFTAGFSDAGHIDHASLSSTALEVVAPDGSSLPVTFLNAIGETSGPYRAACFAVVPASGKWTPEQAGIYQVRLRAGAVRTLSGGAFAAAEIGTFQIAPAASGSLLLSEKNVETPGLPYASLTATELPKKPGDPLLIKVSFHDSHGVAMESVGFGDVLFLGTNGVFAFADLGTSISSGQTEIAYKIAAPDGGWPVEGSRGRLQFKAWQVHDQNGAFFGETALGIIEIPQASKPQ